MDESCGKCIPCRAGTVQLHRLLTKIVRGEAYPADLEQLKQLCPMVQETSLCGLGQTAPNPVLSTLRYFRPEYTGRLKEPDVRPPPHRCSLRRRRREPRGDSPA